MKIKKKKLRSLFDDLKTIFNENENENESVNENENENESVNENDNDIDNDNENKSDDGQYYKIKQINDIFKMIDQKPSEDQVDILKKYLG